MFTDQGFFYFVLVNTFLIIICSKYYFNISIFKVNNFWCENICLNNSTFVFGISIKKIMKNNKKPDFVIEEINKWIIADINNSKFATQQVKLYSVIDLLFSRISSLSLLYWC